jgi:hypothetical protein
MRPKIRARLLIQAGNSGRESQAACAAVLHNRRAAGSEILREYADIAKERITAAFEHRLERRPIHRPVYRPDPSSKIAKRPQEFDYPMLPLPPQVNGD